MRVTPIFKGATRPACVMGIPLKPFVLVCGVFLLLAFWFYVPILFVLPLALWVMKKVTEDDDQAFDQWLIHLRTVFQATRERSWGSVSSFLPVNYKKTKGEK